MVLAMAAFAIEDMFIKAAAEIISLGIVLALFGLGGMIVFVLLTWRKGESVLRPEVLSKPIVIRAFCEVVGRLCFAFAITLTPLSSASAILQATPLVVVLGASFIFKEQVGLSRWLAISVGFCGVLMIIRPGLEDFDPASLFAVLSTLGFAGRDLATRGASEQLSNTHLGVYGFFVLIPTGLILQFVGEPVLEGAVVQGVIVEGTVIERGIIELLMMPFAQEAYLYVLGSVIFGVVAYNSLTIAMRTGEVSVVTPFRYTRLLFALLLGIVVFNETPDIWTLAGGFIVVFSGVYALLGSRQKRQHQVDAPS